MTPRDRIEGGNWRAPWRGLAVARPCAGREFAQAHHVAARTAPPRPLPTLVHGGASVVVILLLAGLAALLVASAHRSLLAEQRTSANLAHAAQAFEAADAGLEWTLAMLNGGDRLDDRCASAPEDAGASTFLDRHLFDRHPPTPTDTPAAAAPSSAPSIPANTEAPGCRHDGTGWSCRCPTTSSPPPSTRSPVQAAFSVTLRRSGPGLVDVVSTGCSGGTGPQPCAPAVGPAPAAQARAQMTLGHIPGLAVDPAAALTVRGSVDLGTSPWTLVQSRLPDRAWALHAGGEVQASQLTVQGANGSPTVLAQLDGDDTLRSLSAQAQFVTLFRMDKTAWRQQPGVRQLDCARGCSAALRQAVGADAEHPMVWIRQGWTVDEPLILGTPTHPVLLVVDGPIRFEAPALIHGLVYGTSPEWDARAGAEVHGAVVLEGDLRARGATRIEHDTSILRDLQEHAGTYARVAGSWRDF